MEPVENKMAATKGDSCATKDPVVNQKPAGNASDGGNVQLDKFKRRLVRAVSRMRQQKKSEEEMWTELKKEIGCDCKMLWQHMRALTLKKLRRLLPANDFLENITKVARFTATDWLLFDLILVHENVDVISVNDQDTTKNIEEEPKCLYELFELVREHNVEGLKGDDLTEAWIRVTLEYNSRGRQCSPMLLQLRWYQLKELCRARFYNFWFSYRGNVRVLDQAMEVRPTELQIAVVKEFKSIITHVYPNWETLIGQGRVVLSEEFTQNREAKRNPEKRCEEKELELIEPQVETIDLEVDSDAAEQSIDANIACPRKQINIKNSGDYEDVAIKTNEIIGPLECSFNNIAVVKSEPIDDVLELDDVSDDQTINIPLEKRTGYIEKHCEELSLETSSIEVDREDKLPKITCVVGNAIESDTCTPEDEINEILEQKAKSLKFLDAAKIDVDDNPFLEHKIESALSHSDDEIDESLHEKAKNLDYTNIEISQIKSVHSGEEEILNMEQNENCLEFPQIAANPKTDVSSSNTEPILCDSDDEMDIYLQDKVQQLMSIEATNTNTRIEALPKIENVSDAVTRTNKDSINKLKQNEKDVIKSEKCLTKEDKNDGLEEVNFDDNGIEFVDDGIEFVDEVNEEKNLKVEEESESPSDANNDIIENGDDNPKIDPKLLLFPIVYTKRLDHMEVFKFIDINIVSDQKVIEYAILESKPMYKPAQKYKSNEKKQEQVGEKCASKHGQSIDIVETANEDTENKVKCTSWLLQKPKNRSYNPIQLCKNPDFNTRLKRLTAGFLSSTRNRTLLKECKPLTIDVHKAFEKKLVNGEICIIDGDFKSAKAVAVDNKSNYQLSVIPSAMPGQSIIFTADASSKASSPIPTPESEAQENNLAMLPIVQKGLSSERNKVIKLPDIDQVRRVNQSLLTAEVTPIRIENNTNNENFLETKNIEVPVVELPFVDPIVVTSTINSIVASATQVKQEPLELVLNTCKEDDTIQYSSHTTKNLIAHNVNDQIINISKQISQVDPTALPSINVEKEDELSRTTINVKKKVKNKPKRIIQVPTSKYTPVNRDGVTWTPKYCKNYFSDSLLTFDTLTKMLFLFGEDEEGLKTVFKHKKCIKTAQNAPPSDKSSNSDLKRCTSENEAEVNISVNEAECSKILITTSESKKINKAAAKSSQTIPPKAKRKKKLLSKLKAYKGVFCCWARERIIFITSKKRLTRPSFHGCRKFSCTCCCRYELIKESTRKRSNNLSAKSNDKTTPTIVLSDDEETNLSSKNISTDLVSKTNLPDNSINTLSVQTGMSPKISIRILPPPLVGISHKTNATNVNIESKGDGKKCTSDVLNFNSNEDKVDSHISNTISNNGQTASDTYRYNRQIDLRISEQQEFVANISAHSETTHEKYMIDVDTLLLDNDKTQSNTDNTMSKNSTGTADEQSCKTQTNSTKELDNSPISNVKKKEHIIFLNNGPLLSKPVNPIYLGKNKILLYSLAKPKSTRITAELPVLPNGVSFVLLPNGELTLSLAPGIQLDPEQLCALPSLVATVQQQMAKSNVINNLITNSNGPSNEKDIIDVGNVTDIDRNSSESSKVLAMEVETATSCDNVIDPSQKDPQTVKSLFNSVNASDVSDINMVPTLDEENVNQAEATKTKSDEIEVLPPLNLEHLKEINITDTSQTENGNMEIGADKYDNKETTTGTEILKEKLPMEVLLNLENNTNNSHAADNTLPPAKASENKNQEFDVNKDVPSSKIINSRKTILSDLMALSGISAEDTTMAPDTSSYRPFSIPLPPNIIPITASVIGTPSITDKHSNTIVNAPEDISIGGQRSNLFSFKPDCPTNYLLNCIAHIRPELNAVTSFSELKYAYENDGIFFKLDIDTGIILPITVCIKKTFKTALSSNPKSVIDLTDDIGENDVIEANTSESCNIDGMEQTISYQDIKQNEQCKSKCVKPIKLFKSVHPAILKRGGQSLIKPNKIIRANKGSCINKQRRKQIINEVAVKTDSEEINVAIECNSLSESYLDLSYDSSDDEPLAKKFKRLKPAEKNVIETIPEYIIDLSRFDCNEIVDNVDIPDNNDTSDTEMNIMDIEGVDPELHPVAFEEGSESEDDMCILGV